jgi:hypothetical protein
MPVSGEEWFAGSLGFRYDFFCRVGWFPPEILGCRLLQSLSCKC